jgi:galactokinase
VIDELGTNAAMDIEVDGQVPLGAGLSSSAALECATALALNELFGLGKSRKELALIAQAAENNYVGMPCGVMDQSASLLSHRGKALLIDCRDLSIEEIPFDVSSAGLELLIIDTQVHHALVDGGYADRRASAELAAQLLGVKTLRDISVHDYVAKKELLDPKTFIRGLHAVTEMARTLAAVEALKGGKYGELGPLLLQSHASLRDHLEVSCPELDLAVESAVAAGALGARMMGGGFGGSAIALSPSKKRSLIESAVKSAFEGAGYNTPRFFMAEPSEGACLL